VRRDARKIEKNKSRVDKRKKARLRAAEAERSRKKEGQQCISEGRAASQKESWSSSDEKGDTRP